MHTMDLVNFIGFHHVMQVEWGGLRQCLENWGLNTSMEVNTIMDHDYMNCDKQIDQIEHIQI